MTIDKNQILEMLRARGEHDQADTAEAELPDQVDTDQHADLLRKIGIDPSDFAGGAGGIGDRLGL